LDTGLLVALLNPGIATVLAAAFLLLFLHQKDRPYLALLCAGYICSALGFLLQYFILPIGFLPTKLISAIAFLLAVCLIGNALVARHHRPLPWRGTAAAALAGLGAYCWFMFMVPDLTWRVLSLNLACGAVSLLIGFELRRIPKANFIDRLLNIFVLLAAANLILRPLLVITIDGPFAGYDTFYGSTYWTTMVLSHALVSLMLALTLFTASAFDIVSALRSDSYTDPLSGLFNRRGFEEQSTEVLDHCARLGLPASLILADLDHFKSINDTHGHEAGDRVIMDFARRLREAAGTRAIAGRLGGEEFAVLLPLTDLAGARLLAEALRTAFAAATIEGLPAGTRTTASFGVAARSGDEPLVPLLRRADDALYKAKQSGRDGVRVSYERPPAPGSTTANLAGTNLGFSGMG